MADPEQFRLLARYNQWMNGKLYAVCSDIPDEARKRDLGAFFGSIHETLNHLLWADRVWTGRFTGEPYSAPNMGRDLYADFADLTEAREAMDAWLIDWTDRLQHAWLEAAFTYTSGVDRIERSLPAWVLVIHLFNHQTHHRGQVTTLMKQLGHDPGVTDLPWMPGVEITAEGGQPT